MTTSETEEALADLLKSIHDLDLWGGIWLSLVPEDIRARYLLNLKKAKQALEGNCVRLGCNDASEEPDFAVAAFMHSQNGLRFGEGA